MASESTQVAVLGAGPGGYAAAFYAADLGMQVTLVDEEPNPGGVCAVDDAMVVRERERQHLARHERGVFPHGFRHRA